MPSTAERHFHAAIVNGAERLKHEIGYNPTRFTQMIGDHGAIEAARHLLRGPTASDGFTTLWEHGRLDVSVEAFVLLPWYRGPFTDAETEAAERRLAAHKFDVERFLRESIRNPPDWWQQDGGTDGV
ncbi:hypothetical protein [Phytoactinopolyspora mesophila]|uniref:Uncharacterized protein n=1 Tax=Phytoactinopolyspora mesophila TaxID=2650750 RepID=A0A7K3M270_9ACTN|nr:hypothetical protein [Phytoactinopolyspora mesophila]NDL57012.1 hypothetical protein [Phytoactinopolyspora mesophila]